MTRLETKNLCFRDFLDTHKLRVKVARVEWFPAFSSDEVLSPLFDPFVEESQYSMNTAVQLWDGQLPVITTPIPHVSTPNEVLVKVAFSGVCRTDLQYRGWRVPVCEMCHLGS